MATGDTLHAVATTGPVSLVGRFYSLEYFYIFLKSIERYADPQRAFDAFKRLKQQHRLGESKFKKVTADPVDLTPTQLNRYRYTFDQVFVECVRYDFVNGSLDSELWLSSAGEALLKEYGTDQFTLSLLHSMESVGGGGFRYLIEKMYAANPQNPGLLIFPIYSPYQLEFERRQIKTTRDVRHYSRTLALRMEMDIRNYLGRSISLSENADEPVSRLIKAGLLPSQSGEPFEPKRYNAIVHRFRKFWLNYFLIDVYGVDLSLSTFDILAYRAKQCGVVHITDFYPNFNGRIAFPTSVIVESNRSRDFSQLHSYPDGKSLFGHHPAGDHGQEQFIKSLVSGYHQLRRTHKGYFINLGSLREIVCYALKISEHCFELLLNQTYALALAGKLRIRISLEVDRLPEDTQASYLKQEPVFVDGKPRNVIGIDVAKGECL